MRASLWSGPPAGMRPATPAFRPAPGRNWDCLEVSSRWFARVTDCRPPRAESRRCGPEAWPALRAGGLAGVAGRRPGRRPAPQRPQTSREGTLTWKSPNGCWRLWGSAPPACAPGHTAGTRPCSRVAAEVYCNSSIRYENNNRMLLYRGVGGVGSHGLRAATGPAGANAARATTSAAGRGTAGCRTRRQRGTGRGPATDAPGTGSEFAIPAGSGLHAAGGRAQG